MTHLWPSHPPAPCCCHDAAIVALKETTSISFQRMHVLSMHPPGIVQKITTLLVQFTRQPTCQVFQHLHWSLLKISKPLLSHQELLTCCLVRLRKCKWFSTPSSGLYSWQVDMQPQLLRTSKTNWTSDFLKTSGIHVSSPYLQKCCQEHRAAVLPAGSAARAAPGATGSCAGRDGAAPSRPQRCGQRRNF